MVAVAEEAATVAITATTAVAAARVDQTVCDDS